MQQTGSDGGPIVAEDGTRNAAKPLDFGGGHGDPNRAANLGLISNRSTMDYVSFLCSLDYTNSSISKLLGQQISCPGTSSALNLNLSFIVVPNLKRTVNVSRTVTNVGPVNSAYKVEVGRQTRKQFQLSTGRNPCRQYILQLSTD